jgi:hypothetical protein
MTCTNHAVWILWSASKGTLYRLLSLHAVTAAGEPPRQPCSKFDVVWVARELITAEFDGAIQRPRGVLLVPGEPSIGVAEVAPSYGLEAD